MSGLNPISEAEEELATLLAGLGLQEEYFRRGKEGMISRNVLNSPKAVEMSVLQKMTASVFTKKGYEESPIWTRGR